MFKTFCKLVWNAEATEMRTGFPSSQPCVVKGSVGTEKATHYLGTVGPVVVGAVSFYRAQHGAPPTPSLAVLSAPGSPGLAACICHKQGQVHQAPSRVHTDRSSQGMMGLAAQFPWRNIMIYSLRI